MDYRNIEKDTIKNTYYRKVIRTTPQMQLVLMSLEPGEDIPEEVHKDITQFIRVERGRGIAKIGKNTVPLYDGISFMIPPNRKHYVANTSTMPLKLYSLYSPPEHKKNRIDKRQP